MTFKNSKTKKSTAKKFRCVVKAAEEKPVELAMTAEVKGVKTIAVKFTQAVNTTTALTVKKGTTETKLEGDPVWNTEGTEATIKTTAKMTAGTYTVSAKVAEDTTLTADAVVEKNETLTSFALVGETLKAKSATETSKGSIEYQALNQYGEPMSCSTANVTIAPGTADPEVRQTPTASKNGKYGVMGLEPVFTVPGYEFNVVIVDTASGVTFNGKVKYGAYARAAKAEAAGLYNTAKSKKQDITAGDKVEDYKALFTVLDQYGDPYEVKKTDVSGANPAITAVAASGVTNVKVGAFSSTDDPLLVVDDVTYFAIPLAPLSTDTTKTSAVAGDFSISIVNNTLGIIGTPSYTVAENVVIADIQIEADGIYADQDNTLNYTITDTKGNNVTSFSVLDKAIKFQGGTAGSTMKWVEQKDGSAKLVYHPATLTSGLNSSIESYTLMANDVTSSNYLVKSFTFTILTKRVPKEIVGVTSNVATSTSVSSGKEITVKLEDLRIADQYGGIFTADELKANDLVKGTQIVVTGAGLNAVAGNTFSNSTTKWEVSGGAIGLTTGAAFNLGSVKFKAPTTTAALTASFKIGILSSDQSKMEGEYTLTMTKVAESAVQNISNLTIESINKGYPVQVTDTALHAVVKDVDEAEVRGSDGNPADVHVVVSGMIGGKKVYLTSSQCDVSIKADTLGVLSGAAKSGKGTVEVSAQTGDGVQTVTKEFDISNAAPVLTTIKADKATVTTTGGINTTQAAFTVNVNNIGAANKGYTTFDQYGNEIEDTNNLIKYKVTFESLQITDGAAVNPATDFYSIVNSGLNSAKVTLNPNSNHDKQTLTVNVSATFNGDTVDYKLVLKSGE